MEQIKELLQDYIKLHPDRKYIVGPDGNLNWSLFGIDPNETDVSKIPYEGVIFLLDGKFFDEDYLD